MSRAEIARPGVPQFIAFECPTRQISLRNTGINTLWVSTVEDGPWFDVACGTSWEERLNIDGFWVQTQTGMTSFVVEGVMLTHSTKIGSAPVLKLLETR